MGLTDKKMYLIKEVFSKIIYDKTSGKYKILPEAYLPLKLSKKEFELLEQMCISDNIELVKFPKKITKQETLSLFKKYHELRKKYKINPSKNIEKEMYKVRDAIAIGHMEIVFLTILKYFPNILERNDREDIYQTGYEMLLIFIDKFDLTKGDYFARYIYKYLVPGLSRRMKLISDNLTFDDNNNLEVLMKKRLSFETKYHREPTNEELKEMLNLCQKEMETLLVIEKLLNSNSLDEKIESEDYIDTALVDDAFEQDVINNIQNEYVVKIIETLPPTQKKCILLYFGFIGNKCWTYYDIGKKLDISQEAVRLSLISAFENIEKTIRGNILNKIYYNQDIDFNEEDDYDKIDDEYLIYFLIKQIPKDQLIELISNLNEKNQDILMLYLGLTDGIEYSRKELSEIFGVSYNTVNRKLRTAINKLILLIDEQFKNKYKGTDREKYSFLENMMIEYINHPRIIRR